MVSLTCFACYYTVLSRFLAIKINQGYWGVHILTQRPPCSTFAEYLVILSMLVSKPREYDSESSRQHVQLHILLWYKKKPLAVSFFDISVVWILWSSTRFELEGRSIFSDRQRKSIFVLFIFFSFLIEWPPLNAQDIVDTALNTNQLILLNDLHF